MHKLKKKRDNYAPKLIFHFFDKSLIHFLIKKLCTFDYLNKRYFFFILFHSRKK